MNKVATRGAAPGHAARLDDHALLTSVEMGAVDRLAAAGVVPAGGFMEAAGAAVAVAISARWPMRPVTVLCGPGNNGGDGYIAARHLSAAGWPVTVAVMGSRAALSGDAAHAASLWTGTIVPFTAKCLDGAGLVVDGIFGAGLSRPLSGAALAIVEALNDRPVPVCAIDLPSGVDGSTGAVLGAAASADLTVTCFRKKLGHLLYPGRGLCGDVVLADIGTPVSVLNTVRPMAWENDPALWLDRFPWPQAESYKYTRGEVLVLGGEAITGASRMTAIAASRGGAGMVTLAAPAKVWSVYATSLINAIVQSFDGLANFSAMLADVRRNVIAIGPGVGVGAATRDYALAALATQRSVVLDADALTSFADAPEDLFAAIKGPCVLTPHAGEFKRLFHFTGDKLHLARSAAKQCQAIVVLKGPDTVIAAPDGRAIINANAPPQLATGGSGDVLTGFVAAMLAQGLPAFEGAAAAVWLHGAAAAAFGLGLVAADLPDALPHVLQRLAAQTKS
ncbi:MULTISPECIES: NAD(P)H-hydrate dehydratase [Sphingosinicellaceae]|uniref:NAD(P)H-hydrate dehydratase n=1 Tax=Sphingosinicellaceae TaxID=2820280 RepID=UPI001C1E0275|nr:MULTISPECIES: NAD(P)H-hydrate dehydratase [Polymorphobacter]QYE33457.1 NAD(P)H-hydrate dehydratase [Polymorphobacter sp. PAMC 29334]UAJ12822.1 NAD(P)H-hydrate dehydratase [Polymorphobacter megasporae]